MLYRATLIATHHPSWRYSKARDIIIFCLFCAIGASASTFKSVLPCLRKIDSYLVCLSNGEDNPLWKKLLFKFDQEVGYTLHIYSDEAVFCSFAAKTPIAPFASPFLSYLSARVLPSANLRRGRCSPVNSRRKFRSFVLHVE